MDKLRSFSRQHRLNGFRACAHGLASQIRPADLPTGYSYTLAPGYPTPGPPIFLRPSIALHNKYRNINLFSIGYGFHPHLRIRLTLGRLPLPRKPRVFGEYVFTYFIVTHVSIITSLQSSMPSGTPSARSERSPTQSPKEIAKASVPCLAPLHFRRRAIRPVSYYAFFKRWLLLSQRPGCLNGSTTFTTEHGFGDLSCWSGLFPF